MMIIVFQVKSCVGSVVMDSKTLIETKTCGYLEWFDSKASSLDLYSHLAVSMDTCSFAAVFENKVWICSLPKGWRIWLLFLVRRSQVGEWQRKWQVYSKSGRARMRADWRKMKAKVKYVAAIMSLEHHAALFAFLTIGGEFSSNFSLKKWELLN